MSHKALKHHHHPLHGNQFQCCVSPFTGNRCPDCGPRHTDLEVALAMGKEASEPAEVEEVADLNAAPVVPAPVVPLALVAPAAAADPADDQDDDATAPKPKGKKKV